MRLVARLRPGFGEARARNLVNVSNGRVRRHIKGIDADVIEVSRENASAFAARLLHSGAFASVEEDQIVQTAAAVNDPYFSEQWGTQRIGAPAAWDTSFGVGVIVGIVDTGIDGTHPELAGRLLPGWDFVDDDGDPSDDNGHGTAMAGIVAAQANNGIGIAGVAPAGLILPVKALDETGFGYYSDVAAGIVYAVDNGARVINLSFGGAGASTILQAAIDYARAHDAVVVAAAGNDASSAPTYPAASEGAVGVSAVGASDQLAWFSNYGSWITLSAPGINVYATAFSPEYTSVAGTSAAAALASGAFALLRAAHPELDATAAIDAMTANADDLGPAGWDEEFGFGCVDAHAAVDPSILAPNDREKPVVVLSSPAKANLVDGIVTVAVTASDNVGVTRVELFVDGLFYAATAIGPYDFAWDTAGLSPGVHSVRAYAYDNAGNSGRSALIRVYVTPGEGLLAQRAKVSAGDGAGDGAVRLKAMLRLPEGFVFDPAVHAVAFTLSGSAQAVLEMQVPAGSMEASRSTAKYRGLAAPPAGGDVNIVIKPNRTGGTYSLQLTGSDLTLLDTSAQMGLTVTVDGNVFTQPLVLRPASGDFVFP